MPEKTELLSLENMCGGAVNEVFQRELSEVLDNIYDINTDPEAKRKLSLEFTLTPFEDRSGASIHFVCKSKLMPTKTVNGTIFLASRAGKIVAVPHNPKQAQLFGEEAEGDAKDKLPKIM